MKISIRKWNTTDERTLASALSNRKVLNNLRDGLPYPYTVCGGGIQASWI